MQYGWLDLFGERWLDVGNFRYPFEANDARLLLLNCERRVDHTGHPSKRRFSKTQSRTQACDGETIHCGKCKDK
jgi:hypothetical protein